MLPQDRRSAPRIDTGNLVIHHELGQSAENSWTTLAVTLDLNEFGLRAQTTEALRLGGRFRFNLAIENDIVQATGRVVHVAKALNGTFEIGVEFLQIGADDIARIRRFLRERRPA